MTHIYVNNLAHDWFIIWLAPVQPETISWTSVGKVLIRPRCSDTNMNQTIVIFIQEINFKISGEFPVQMASNAENVSIWWRHHDVLDFYTVWNVSTLRFSHYSNIQSHNLLHKFQNKVIKPWYHPKFASFIKNFM